MARLILLISITKFNIPLNFQVNFMVPLDKEGLRQCKEIAKRQEEKMRLDYELVRALKCTEIMKSGFTFRPGSRVSVLCQDIVPIVLIDKTDLNW